MNEEVQGWVLWMHVSGDAVIAACCLVILSSLFYLAHKYRVKRISSVFTVFGAVFLCGGLLHVLEVMAATLADGWLVWAGYLKLITAAACGAAAVITVRCAKDALVGFTRLAVLERKMGERISDLGTDPRFHNAGDQAWRKDLTEVRRMARALVEYVPTGGAEGEQGVE